jgi:ribonuclease HII
MLHHEQVAWKDGFKAVAGVDEVGRGPLAGPVVACCVMIQRPFLESGSDSVWAGLTDSKKLSAPRREYFFTLLVQSPHVCYGLAQVDVEEIDAINILRATHRAMALALTALDPPADLALVDGLPVPGLPCPSRSIVKGDSLSLSIAAASVLAKVTRDRLMQELDREYPAYGFASHKGYGTRQHLEALRKYGPTPAHRKSFEPVRACFQPVQSALSLM